MRPFQILLSMEEGSSILENSQQSAIVCASGHLVSVIAFISTYGHSLPPSQGRHSRPQTSSAQRHRSLDDARSCARSGMVPRSMVRRCLLTSHPGYRSGRTRITVMKALIWKRQKQETPQSSLRRDLQGSRPSSGEGFCVSPSGCPWLPISRSCTITPCPPW